MGINPRTTTATKSNLKLLVQIKNKFEGTFVNNELLNAAAGTLFAEMNNLSNILETDNYDNTNVFIIFNQIEYCLFKSNNSYWTDNCIIKYIDLHDKVTTIANELLQQATEFEYKSKKVPNGTTITTITEQLDNIDLDSDNQEEMKENLQEFKDKMLLFLSYWNNYYAIKEYLFYLNEYTPKIAEFEDSDSSGNGCQASEGDSGGSQASAGDGPVSRGDSGGDSGDSPAREDQHKMLLRRFDRLNAESKEWLLNHINESEINKLRELEMQENELNQQQQQQGGVLSRMRQAAQQLVFGGGDSEGDSSCEIDMNVSSSSDSNEPQQQQQQQEQKQENKENKEEKEQKQEQKQEPTKAEIIEPLIIKYENKFLINTRDLNLIKKYIDNATLKEIYDLKNGQSKETMLLEFVQDLASIIEMDNDSNNDLLQATTVLDKAIAPYMIDILHKTMVKISKNINYKTQEIEGIEPLTLYRGKLVGKIIENDNYDKEDKVNELFKLLKPLEGNRYLSNEDISAIEDFLTEE